MRRGARRARTAGVDVVQGHVTVVPSGRETPAGASVVAEPLFVRVVVWVGMPLLGAGAGWLVRWGADWADSLPWAPFDGLWRLVASLPEPEVTVGAVVVGALLGLGVSLVAAAERLTVTVTPGSVTLRRGNGSVREIHRAAIGAAFLDGKQLVLLGRTTEELAREQSDLEGKDLAGAFTAHGYPWHAGGDPHRDEYRRYVEGMPDLPPGADALLRARQRALDKGDGDDLAQFRGELARIGLAVRDEKKRQFWRRTAAGGDPPGAAERS